MGSEPQVAALGEAVEPDLGTMRHMGKYLHGSKRIRKVKSYPQA
jgi:hypothetical protein